MTCWIFQANPDQFDLDGYLNSAPGRITYKVSQHATEMREGDQVFLWRAIGSGPKENAGIVCEARISSPVSRMPEDEAAAPFWLDPEKKGGAMPRVWLEVKRVANKKEMIKRDWMEDDPILRDLRIFKLRNETNYPLERTHAKRLNDLWLRTGRDWNRSEVVAALWAYDETFGREISRKPASPVAVVSLQTGRAIGGVYNKLMNLRSLDPREKERGRKGLPGAAEKDREVWAEFFDDKGETLRSAAVAAEYARLWGLEEKPERDAAEALRTLDEEAKKLEKQPLSKLLAAYRRAAGGKARSAPRAERSVSVGFDRSPLVVAIAKVRANRRCEVPGCRVEVFLTTDGLPYLEVHHLTPLAEGGADSIENAACLCASHHREMHYGTNKAALTAAIRALREADAA